MNIITFTNKDIKQLQSHTIKLTEAKKQLKYKEGIEEILETIDIQLELIINILANNIKQNEN